MTLFRISLLFVFFILSCQKNEKVEKETDDWLIDNRNYTASIIEDESNSEIILENGLIRRKIMLKPDVFTYDYTNLKTGQQLLRSVESEARIKINGNWYDIGGVKTPKERAYLIENDILNAREKSNNFVFDKTEIKNLSPLLDWNDKNWWASNKKGAAGKEISFSYTSTSSDLNGTQVQVHYAIYDGLPVISKWVTVENNTDKEISVDQIIHEQLSLVEEESAVVGSLVDMKKSKGIYIESDFAFNNAMNYRLSDQTTHWEADSTYTSQVNYDLTTPAILKIYPKDGIGVKVGPGEHLRSVRSWELLMDSYDRERRGLAKRKMYRQIAPWVTANPIFMHLVSKDDEEVYKAVDQAAEVGYEAVILSFGSHLNMEDISNENLNKWKRIADYAHGKSVKIGGYSLFSSRSIDNENDVINPETGKPGDTFFGNAPCFGSEWGLIYSEKIKTFYKKTGFDIWENDGPYPGDRCASTDHPGHEGLADSQWKQFNMQASLYQWLNRRGVYINSPDWYFLQGSHKIGLGYREVNFSLSRENQKILNRQNIYDGTWEKTPSMGWGFVPLTAYHGGGKEAILEPLNEHLEDYKQLMVQYYGAGVQAMYRGPRLYDTKETKEMVTEVINWYKQYRNILNQDIIHLRRPDGRDWDGILHVDPEGDINGFGLLYNPLSEEIIREIELPVYYTGATDKVSLSFQEKESQEYTVSRGFHITVKIKIPANGYTWFTLENI